ncbi:hypothetical protein [Micromonospora peucetia]|uniref:Membrane domain of glycerophosphoryl diester phosphodiesterase n=1 Tax=Micromonospora peucetia TaxID=47871 RepID=A0A1C6UDP0_9ACTN|nr:hypothetical protein [Micromonospora peucetia]WSA33878.1 hypothetical protein OIE14_07485 [Micromonospora peucetia]SCL52078.1 hypothetical protein GA0070608_0958 [Micromonospora peucetia]
MPDAGPIAVLPRRPLTVGELLDSAVLLLRGQARVLIPVALVLAVAEQLLLYPLRLAAGTTPPVWFLEFGRFGAYWLLLAVGAAIEAVIILLLGNPAARAAGAALFGRAAGLRELLRPAGARWGATALLAALVGAVMCGFALFGPVWLVGFGLLGAVAPALVVDRVHPLRAPLRAAVLALRAGGRATWIRLLGYLVWWIVRLGLGIGVYLGLDSFDLVDRAWAGWLSLAVWAGVNSVAYPALACLDAVLHLETRMRTEGLDIRLSRARAGAPETVLLAAGR